jgi:rod shape-determining protein MreC
MLQFLLKRKSILLIALLFLIAVTLVARDMEKREGGGFFDTIVLPFVSSPLQVSTDFLQVCSNLTQNYVFLINLRSENSQLKNIIDQLQLENQLLREESSENKRLRDLLAFKTKLPYAVVSAEIIGRDPSSWFRTILIDKGAAAGIQRGAAVITPRGIAGKILEVQAHTAKVLLLIDRNCALDILVQRSRAKGILEGRAADRCEVNFVGKTEDVKVGDIIVTSGLDADVPKGFVAGEVVNVNKTAAGYFQFVEVRPAVDFSKLEEVLVVKK